MIFTLQKRTIKAGTTITYEQDDISFLPSFRVDEKRADKFIDGEPQDFEVKKTTSGRESGQQKFKSFVNYFMVNMPERYFNENDLTREIEPCWKSISHFELYLSDAVGWVIPIRKPDGEIYSMPRLHKAADEPDRIEVDEKYYQPASDRYNSK